MSKRAVRSPEERARLMEQVEADIARGRSTKEATVAAGIPTNLFYKWKSDAKLSRTKRAVAQGPKPVKKKPTAKKPSVSRLYLPDALPMTTNDGRVIALLGSPEKIAEIIARL